MAQLKTSKSNTQSLFALSDASTALDPKLAALFSATVKPSFLPHAQQSASASSKPRPLQSKSSEPSFQSDSSEDSAQSAHAEHSSPTLYSSGSGKSKAADDETAPQPERQLRRKRKRENEDLEGRYLQKLAREEAKETGQRQAERAAIRTNQPDDNDDDANVPQGSDDDNDDDDDDVEDAVHQDADDPIPQHESLSKPEEDPELQKAGRTVFLANVSTAAMTSKSSKRTLLNHLTSIFPSSPESGLPARIESLRFRSTAYSNAVPKKAAFARKELMDATTKSTNAYVVYSTNQAAREAARKLNGTVVLGRHLRVDEVAHPAKIDHHRCVFVGNLGFVDDESQIEANADGDGKKRKAQKGDVEEGLWQQFAKAGTVESVRVVRDPKTRVGKGFAYVQFVDENAVEAALLYNDKKFPPLLPRKLRVVRAKKVRRDGSTGSKSAPPSSRPASAAKKPKGSGTASEQTLRGRVKKLLGRAGAAQMGKPPKGSDAKGSRSSKIKPPEAFVFEGHRASSTQGNRGLKLGGSQRKKGGKPKNGRAKRAAAWKTQGGKKG